MEEQVRKELLQICNDIIQNEEDSAIEDQLTSVQMLYEKLLVLNYLSSRKSTRATRTPEPPETKTVEPQTIPDVRESMPEQPLMEEKPEVKPEPIAREPEAAPQVPQQETPPPAQQEHKPQSPYRTPEFVRADEQPAKPTSSPQVSKAPSINESPVELRELVDDRTPEDEKEKMPPQREASVRQSSINERYGTGTIRLGLNDRIAFMNHLFDGSQEDLNRVLSQINTFESFAEAENFIEQMVKPDYDWSQKEEFEMRFMDVVRQKFGE